MVRSLMQGRRQFSPTCAGVVLWAALSSGPASSQITDADREAVLRDMRTGQSALQHQDYQGAEDAFQRAAKAAPDFADAYLGLGLTQLRSGESKEAVSALRRAVELSPELKGPHLFLGMAEIQTGQVQEAAESLHAELALSPDSLEAMRWLALVELGRERAKEAVALLDHATELSPKDPELLYYQARAHEQIAKDAFRKLYEIDPDSVLVHRGLGESLSESGQPEKAIAEFDAALRKDPQNADLYELVADEQAKLARYQEAATTYRKELALNPRSAIALYNLGRIDVEHGKPTEGVAELRQALQANARPAPTMYYLGFGLMQLGENADAEKALQASLASSPSSFIEQSALFQLVRVYQRLNRKKDAEQALNRLKQVKASAAPDRTDVEDPVGTAPLTPLRNPVAKPEHR